MFTSFRLFAQDIIYKPVFISQCTDSLAESPLLFISDSDGNHYKPVHFSTTNTYLPKLGKYSLYLAQWEPEIINIDKYGETVDTFYTERIQFSVHMSNPPHSEFIDCGSLANGKVTDVYYNGNIRLTSNFSNGQPIDTLKKYYRSGIMQELYIPQKRHKQHIHYYRNGQIWTDYNYAKRYSEEYYESGELKKRTKWNRKFHKEKFEYYKNGQIKIKENKKNQTRYFSNGLIKNQTTRKEVQKLKKILSRNRTPWFEYQCNILDSLGNKLAFIQYRGINFGYGNYPDSISQIRDYQFKKVLLYKNGQEINKFYFKFEKEGTSYVTKMILYKKKDDVWIETEITTANNIYKTLVSHLKYNAL